MSIEAQIRSATRAGDQVKAAQAVAVAKRGMFALIERRCHASWLLGAYAIHVTYTPCVVASATRDGIVKAVKLVGQDWPLKRSDWHEITVDSRQQITDPAAVAAKLVDEDGRAKRYTGKAEAVAAIKAASGIA